MEVAATKNCRDYPQPKDPANLSTYSSSTAASSSDYTDSSTSTTTPDTGATTTAPPAGADTNGDGYPDNQYAPGIQGNGNGK